MHVLLCVVLCIRVSHNVRPYLDILGSWHIEAQEPNIPESRTHATAALLGVVKKKVRVKDVGRQQEPSRHK